MWPVHLCQNIPTFLTLIINSFYLFNAQCLFNPVRSVLFLGLLPRTLTPTEKRVSVIIADPALLLGLEQFPLPREGNVCFVLKLTGKDEAVSAERVASGSFAEACVVLRLAEGLAFG